MSKAIKDVFKKRAEKVDSDSDDDDDFKETNVSKNAPPQTPPQSPSDTGPTISAEGKKKITRKLAFDTPIKGEKRKTGRKQKTPTKVSENESESEEEYKNLAAPTTDPDFDLLTKEITASKDVNKLKKLDNLKLDNLKLEADKIQSEIESMITILESDLGNIPDEKQTYVTTAISQLQDDIETTLYDPDLSSDERLMEMKMHFKRANTLVSKCDNLKKEKIQSKQQDDAKLNYQSTSKDESPKFHTSTDTDKTLDEKVSKAMEHLRKHPKYDPNMEDKIKDAMKNYYTALQNKQDESKGQSHQQPQNPNDKKCSTTKVFNRR